MPRWFKLTAFVAMIAWLVVEYFKAAPGTIGYALHFVVGLVAWGGWFAIEWVDRRQRGPDGKPIPLNLTGGVTPRWLKVAIPVALVLFFAIQAVETPRALGLLGGSLLMLVYLLVWGGAFAVYQDARHGSGSDELTTLNLTGK